MKAVVALLTGIVIVIVAYTYVLGSRHMAVPLQQSVGQPTPSHSSDDPEVGELVRRIAGKDEADAVQAVRALAGLVPSHHDAFGALLQAANDRRFVVEREAHSELRQFPDFADQAIPELLSRMDKPAGEISSIADIQQTVASFGEKAIPSLIQGLSGTPDHAARCVLILDILKLPPGVSRARAFAPYEKDLIHVLELSPTRKTSLSLRG